MKTREVKFEPVEPQGPVQKKKGSWWTGVGAVLVVLVLIGASAVVFAQLSAHRQGPGQSKNPLAGKWVPVLKGYMLTSLVAADSNPSTLYACATHAQPYTPLPSNGVGTGEPVYTVLRSTDAGAHWQDVGEKANLGYSCQVAANPANGNELYAVGLGASNGQAAGFLKHSLDGGATWTTIQPLLNWPSVQSTQVWNVQQFSMVHGRLFGLQWIIRHPLPTTYQGTPPRPFPLIRLVMSIDNGHTWIVLDSQFNTANKEAQAYAVDPTNSSTIYELVGTPWWPIQPGIVQPNDVLPAGGYSRDLYKTTDNGATWRLVLKGLPNSAHVQLVRGNAQMIYAGGSQTPVPYTLKAPGADRYSAYGLFNLELSRDGGASWHVVPSPLGQGYFQNWFVGANGRVYAYTLNPQVIPPGGQTTAVAGTAVAVTPVPAVTRTVPTGLLAPGGGSSAAPAEPAVTQEPTGTLGPYSSIERYDPDRDAWSPVTNPPVYGALLAVTPGGSGGDVLWFMGEDKGQKVLYMFIV